MTPSTSETRNNPPFASLGNNRCIPPNPQSDVFSNERLGIDTMLILYAELSSPAVSIQRPIRDGFLQVVGLYVGTCLEVGDSAAHSQYAVVGSGTKPQTVHSLLHNGTAFVGKDTMLACELTCHLRIAVHTGIVLETLCLNGSRRKHSLTYRGAALRRLCLPQVGHRHRRHLNMKVIPKRDNRGLFIY